MGIFSSLKKSWDDRATDAAAFKLVQKAIASADPEGVHTVFGQLPDKERFVEKNQNELLSQAISRKDARTFLALLQHTENPNVVLSFTYSNSRSGSVTYHYPLINRALNIGAHDIALALAQDSRVNLENNYSGRGALLDAARSAGMNDVLQVLLRRTASLRRQEADALDREAADIGNPHIVLPPKV